MMTNREHLKIFFATDNDYIKLHTHELYNLMRNLHPDDVISLMEHRQLIELIAGLRQIIEDNDRLHGENFNSTLESLLSVGEDGLYSDPLRFLFELIQNVDDADYDDLSNVKLSITFQGNNIQLVYNERGFSPFNVFAITGVAEAAKNIDDSKVEIGEKGLGFKSVFGIAESVLIQSGLFSFRLDKKHFTIPIPEYYNYSPVKGTRLTLTLKSSDEVERICRLIKERYCKTNAIFQQNPMLFLNKLTELELLVDNASKQLLFIAERKEKHTVNDHLSVERGVTISASLKSFSVEKAEGDFRESIIGDRYTYATTYTRSMCKARYGANTKLTKKLMTLQVIFPHKEYLGLSKAIEAGALYSFLPTQVTINAPIIVHAPFKLDGSREYVDSQNNNEWFRYTIDRLFDMLNESLVDMAHMVRENVLRYIPKKHMFIFSGSKIHSLRDPIYKGERLLSGRIFWGIDEKYHTRNEIKAYGGDVPIAEQKRIYNVLKGSYHLFVVPTGLKASDFGVDVVEDPYRTLLARSLYDVKIMQLALPIFADWITNTSENELLRRLDEYIPADTKIASKHAANYIGGDEYKKKLSLNHVNLMAQYPVFAEPFSKWVQRRIATSIADYPFEFSDAPTTCNITTIDQNNVFDIDDVGPNMRKYLQIVNCKCVRIPGKCICIPTREGLLLSSHGGLDLFAAFCKIMDKNSQFDITLRLMANSKKLNDAEETMSTEEFLQLLKDVRVAGKQALGKSYESYFNLLHQSGASPVRFINELIQNADDCDYPNDVVPHMIIKATDKGLGIAYNEAGFTKHNVRAITAIGESTKKQLLSGQMFSKETIGEKGIGFKAVFSIAREVFVHSNGFHFALRDSAPTVPVLGIEEKYQDKQGTYIEMALKETLPASLFTRESLLSLCLCLRNIKQITCNNTQVEICDTDDIRKITIDGTVHEFEIHKYSFRVTDQQALHERQHGSRIITPEQTIVCYVPTSSQRKSEYYLYSGLPTKIRMNIPMYIDAPFELTTSRDYVLENSWNKIVRDHVYRAIYEYTNKAKEKLLIRSLRFVAVKQQANTYQNNTFEGDVFLNAVALNEYARFNVYVPAVNEQLRQTNLTKKYPAFIRRMISFAFSNTSEAGSTLNYSDDEYNAAFLYLGGQIAKSEDILAVLKKANLQELLKEEVFRKQLYSWFEGERNISHSVRSLHIIPVWDSVPGTVRYVSYEGKPIYREYGKNVSGSSEYWVLNEAQMTTAMFVKIIDDSIETMDHEHAVSMYKKKFLSTIKPLSAQLAYRHMIQESSTNPLFMEALQTMTPDEQRWLSIQNLDGEIVDSHRVFTLAHGQEVFGKMLRKYIASPECYALALALSRKSVEEIQIGDVEDYEGTLSGEDLEDLLKSDFPRIRYGRSIAREFYDEGKVEQNAAEEYGLVFVPVSIETGNWQFPHAKLISAEKLRNDMLVRLNKAPSIISKTVEKKVRGWVSPKDGSFCEFDQRTGRLEQLANYEAKENSDFCFCQMCRKAKRKAYIEVTCIQQEPSLFLPQIYLSLCLECSKRFQGLRATKKSNFSRELFMKIINARITGSGSVIVDMEDSFDLSLSFTETHLAEIQAVLPKLNEIVERSIDNAQNVCYTPISNLNASTVVKTTPVSVPCSDLTVVGSELYLDNPPKSDKNSEKETGFFTVHVTGIEAGDYRMFVYSGKLKKHTDIKPKQRFIQVVHQGKERLMPVSFVAQEQTLYIAKNIYATYAKTIQQMSSLHMMETLSL